MSSDEDNIDVHAYLQVFAILCAKDTVSFYSPEKQPQH